MSFPAPLERKGLPAVSVYAHRCVDGAVSASRVHACAGVFACYTRVCMCIGEGGGAQPGGGSGGACAASRAAGAGPGTGPGGRCCGLKHQGFLLPPSFPRRWRGEPHRAARKMTVHVLLTDAPVRAL